MIYYQSPAEKLREQIARRPHTLCCVKGCDTQADGLHQYCNRHRMRKRVLGHPDSRIPNPHRVRLLIRLANQLLYRCDAEGLGKIEAQVAALCLSMGNDNPRGNATKIAKPKAARLIYDNVHPSPRQGFTARDMIARASVALSIESTGLFRFPNKESYQAFIGRMLSGRPRGTNVSANDARWVYRRFWPVVGPVAKLLAEPVATKLITMSDKGNAQAIKLVHYLTDCQTKTIPSKSATRKAIDWIERFN